MPPSTGLYTAVLVTGRLKVKTGVVLADFFVRQIWIKIDMCPTDSFLYGDGTNQLFDSYIR